MRGLALFDKQKLCLGIFIRASRPSSVRRFSGQISEGKRERDKGEKKKINRPMQFAKTAKILFRTDFVQKKEKKDSINAIKRLRGFVNLCKKCVNACAIDFIS